MFTIITTPKPLNVIKNRVAFQNAIRSWMRLRPKPEVLVFGGDRAIVGAEGARYITGYRSNESGLPYLDSMIEVAHREATNDIILFTSDHLILFQDLVKAIQQVSDKFPKFLIVGQRHEIDLPELMLMDDRWEQRLRKHIEDYGKLGGLAAKDYMIWRRPLDFEILPFHIGRPRYDSWLLYAAIKAGIPTIDATGGITALHPRHDFPGGRVARSNSPETLRNIELGKWAGGYTLELASWELTEHGLRKRPPYQDLSRNYADPAIAGLQRLTVEKELKDMYGGKVCGFYQLAGNIINKIKEEEPEWVSATLLDIACGSANYSEVLEFLCPGWVDYTGIDYNPGMLELAHKCYPGIQVEQGNILDIPRESDTFDIVLSSATIGHVRGWPRAVRELSRVTRKWLILHRNLVWNKDTERIVRRDYGIDVMVTQFYKHSLVTSTVDLGMELIDIYGMEEWGIKGMRTYLFRKRY